MTTDFQLVVELDERLANPGDSLPLKGHIALGGYSVGGRDFTLPNGMDYDLILTNAGEGILVTGLLRAHVEGLCDRCLDKATFEIASEVNEYFLFEAPQEDPQEEDEGDEEDVDYALVSDDKTIDLTDALSAALVIDTPFVVLCKPDCKGLCPYCGHNLNEGDCGCATKYAEGRLEDSPFAVLKNLHLDGNKQ